MMNTGVVDYTKTLKINGKYSKKREKTTRYWKLSKGYGNRGTSKVGAWFLHL